MRDARELIEVEHVGERDRRRSKLVNENSGPVLGKTEESLERDDISVQYDEKERWRIWRNLLVDQNGICVSQALYLGCLSGERLWPYWYVLMAVGTAGYVLK